MTSEGAGNGDGDGDDQVADLTFRARALAQAHPLSAAASAYRHRVLETERSTQPLPEFADWAATAFLVGYCLRRVEEADTAAIPAELTAEVDLDALGRGAVELSDDLRQGRPAGAELLPVRVVEELLNTVIGTEIDKRAEHWKANVSTEDWNQFEQYAAWWVIHGYALRAAEARGSGSTVR